MRRILLAFGKAILFTILCILFTILLSLPIGELIPNEQAAALASGDMADSPAWILNLTYLVVIIGTMAALFIVRKLISKQSLVSAGLATDKGVREFGEGWLLGMVLVTVGYVLLVISGMAASTGFNFQPATLIGWFVLFLLQPFAEELLFRGYLMSLLARYFNIKVAVLISALVFALVHASNDGFSTMGFITISIAGLLFGLLFLKTGQLWLATGMHAAWNFMQGVAYGFPTSGIRTYSLTNTTTSGPDWLSGGAFGFEGSILAILLLIAAIWWYRNSLREEKLTDMIERSFRTVPTTTIDQKILDDNFE
ncbi:CPBP family intramembrane glutamic endopeptidase [Flavilitoribacter nigricans]|nr:CPBP family intramembrane glutamic endopeptidase [Flavilitoribacter nigricans]